MNALELLARRAGREMMCDEAIKAIADELILDRIQPLGALRMVRAHVVLMAGRMRDERGLHGAYGR